MQDDDRRNTSASSSATTATATSRHSDTDSDATATPSSLPLRASAAQHAAGATTTTAAREGDGDVYARALRGEAARLCARLRRVDATAAAQQQRARTQLAREHAALSRGAREQRVRLRRRLSAARAECDAARARVTAATRRRDAEQQRAAAAEQRVGGEAAALDALLQRMLGVWRAVAAGPRCVEDAQGCVALQPAAAAGDAASSAAPWRDGEALVRRLVMLHTHRRAHNGAVVAAREVGEAAAVVSSSPPPRRRGCAAPVRVVAVVGGAPASGEDVVRVDAAARCVSVRGALPGVARRFVFDDVCDGGGAAASLFRVHVAPLLRRACARRGGGNVCVLVCGGDASGVLLPALQARSEDGALRCGSNSSGDGDTAAAQSSPLLVGVRGVTCGGGGEEDDKGDDGVLSRTLSWVMARYAADAAAVSVALARGDGVAVTAARVSVCDVRGDDVVDLLREGGGDKDGAAAVTRVAVAGVGEALRCVRVAAARRQRDASHVIVRIDLDVVGAPRDAGGAGGCGDCGGGGGAATVLHRVLRHATASSARRWRVGVALVGLAPHDAGDGGGDDGLSQERRRRQQQQQRRTRASLVALGGALVALQRRAAVGVCVGDGGGVCGGRVGGRVGVSRVAPVVAPLRPSRGAAAAASSPTRRAAAAAAAALSVRGVASWRASALTRALQPLLSARGAARVLLVACVSRPQCDGGCDEGAAELARLRFAARLPRVLAGVRATLAYAARVRDAAAAAGY